METLRQALKNHFGYSGFRESQEEIVRAILDKRNVLAVLPTGAGKSLCYQLPALLSPGFSIVVSPLIALMKDQVDQLKELKAEADFINSTMDIREADGIFRKIAEKKVKLLYVAPERLASAAFAERMKALKPDFLFVDEAHCISEWGHNFRPSYRKIKEFKAYIGIKDIAAFTATATPEVAKDIIRQLELDEPKIFVSGFERKNISISVFSDRHKRAKLLEVMHQYESPAIVYTSSRKNAEDIYEFLCLNGFSARYYHAGQDAVIRRHVQDEFIGGKIPIIVATNAFGMGIDKSNIRLIVHYNMPGSVENYYQEIGRAGRDGKPAHAVFGDEQKDESIHQYFIANSYPVKELIKSIYDALCDYGKIAVGMPSQGEVLVNYDFLRAVLRQPELSKAIVSAALLILEDAGYMRLISDLAKKVSFRFLVEKEHLQNYIKTTNDNFKKLMLLQILRLYGGKTFSENSYISVPEIAAGSDGTEREVESALNQLQQAGMLQYRKPSTGSDAVTLMQPRVSSERLQIDYKRINENYLRAQKKLAQIVSYVFTTDCRFRYVLDYFGQKDADYRCGTCDNCITSQPGSDESVAYLQETVLLCLSSFEEGIPESSLITLLKGTSSSAAYRSAPQFGVLHHYENDELKKVVHTLLSRSLLRNDYRRKSRVLITNQGLEWLYEKKLLQRKEEKAAYEEDLELFHMLKDARGKAASKFTQSAFLICADDVLKEIVRKKPDTKYALLEVKGFNERMFNKFGQDILTAIEDWKDKYASSPTGERKLSANLEETYKLLNEGYRLKDIASLRNSSEAIISMQIETIIEFDPGTDISKVIDPVLIEKLKPKFRQGVKDLKDLKKILNSEYDYPEIRIALAKLKSM